MIVSDYNGIDLLQEQPAPPPRANGALVAVVLVLGLLLLFAVVGVALVRQGMTQPESGPAPQFSLTTFDGQTFDLAQQQGKIVVLNFWGYWCGPCRDEAPILQSIYEQYRERGVEMIGVTFLAPELDRTLAFLAEFGITYPNGDDVRSRIADAYRITGAPETFVIDQEGEIARFYFGPIVEAGGGPMSASDLTGVLDCLLTYTGEEADGCIAGLDEHSSAAREDHAS